ncbi:11148_t:CDS:2 [Racocetra fulgida]|uniref:11148_t:CDS:1 n=1 Tax=Racocetra fulgida TaxID=60492 RepID=A0A9N8ZVF4_9GLOM|nr:11148_t:CDS:2 [Racocetra fulgida]
MDLTISESLNESFEVTSLDKSADITISEDKNFEITSLDKNHFINNNWNL